MNSKLARIEREAEEAKQKREADLKQDSTYLAFRRMLDNPETKHLMVMLVHMLDNHRKNRDEVGCG